MLLCKAIFFICILLIFSWRKNYRKVRDIFVEVKRALDRHQNPLGSFAQIIHVSRPAHARFQLNKSEATSLILCQFPVSFLLCITWTSQRQITSSSPQWTLSKPKIPLLFAFLASSLEHIVIPFLFITRFFNISVPITNLQKGKDDALHLSCVRQWCQLK